MISFNNVTKQYGDKILYKDASFIIRATDRIGLVGPNGAGKTTVFRVLMKQEGIDSGSVSVPDKIVMGYFSQSVSEMKGGTALEYVLRGAGVISVLAKKLETFEKQLEDIAENPISDDAMTDLLEKYGEAQLEFEQRGGYQLESRAKEILSGLGLSTEEFDKDVETFSGGWRMRIELSRILALNPDVLLMDEPTNYLDLESIIWLEDWLKNFKGAIVMTSHDREFINRSVTRIVEIANQQITTYSGNYDFYERERDIRLEQLVSQHSRQQDMLAKEEEFISRFAARASHAAQVQSRVKKLEKIERIEIPVDEKTINFTFPTPPRSGNDVVKIENLEKSWISEKADKKREKLVFKGASGMVRRLDRIALVGVNGAGKSTLLKIIVGQASATAGRCDLGTGVKIGYFSQFSLDVLDPNKTVFDEVFGRIPDPSIGYVRNLLAAFLFQGDEVYKKISVLSGGEKSRVILATLLANPINLLVLDEPTNHLDIKSKEVLLKSLKTFDGTVLMVSHDRFFLREVATRVFELDKGELRIFEGGFDYYLSKRDSLHH